MHRGPLVDQSPRSIWKYSDEFVNYGLQITFELSQWRDRHGSLTQARLFPLRIPRHMATVWHTSTYLPEPFGHGSVSLQAIYLDTSAPGKSSLELQSGLGQRLLRRAALSTCSKTSR
jgi:hypothetical protein